MSLPLIPNIPGTVTLGENPNDSAIPNSPDCYPGIIYPSEVSPTVTLTPAVLGTVNPSTSTPGTLTLTPH